MSSCPHRPLIRTIPRDLDRGLSWWRQLGLARVVAGQLAAGTPAAVVLAVVFGTAPTSMPPLAIAAAALLAVELTGQVRFGRWLGDRADRGAAPAPGAARLAVGALVALLPPLAAGAALVAAVAAALHPAVVGAAGATALAASAWALVALGRVALRTVGGAAAADRPPRPAVGAMTFAQLSLFAATGAVGGVIVVALGGVGAAGSGRLDPSAPLAVPEIRALVRAQVIQLAVVRGLWMFTAAWAWCTWIAVARGAAPASEGGRWRSSSPTEPS